MGNRVKLILSVSYDPSMLHARIKPKDIDDKRLQETWGNRLSMIVFEVADKKSGNIGIEIFENNKLGMRPKSISGHIQTN